MSYRRGMQAINLEMPERIPHTEYLSHRQFIIKITGIDAEDKATGGKAGPAVA